MKTSIAFLCVSIFVAMVGITNVTAVTNLDNGTAVIAAKSNTKGGDEASVIMPEGLTPKQTEILALAYQVAKEDGHKYPERVQGILLQESQAGGLDSYKVAGQELGAKGANKYFGIGQMKIGAAMAVLNRFPSMWKYMQTREPEEVMANLILNDEFSVRMVSKYLIIVGGTDDKSITAYNQGPGGAKLIKDPSTFHYTASVKRYANSALVRTVNRLFGNEPYHAMR